MMFESREPSYVRMVRNPENPSQFQPEYAPKGMRAIQTQEGKPYFVPIGDPGGVGVYGQERSFASGPLVKFDDPEQERIAGAYTKTAMRKPTDLPYKEKQQGGAGFNEMSSPQLQTFIQNAPEGRIRLAGQNELAKRETTKQSLALSELLRRGRIEGLL